MSHFDSILSELKVKGIISDPLHPEPFFATYKGRRSQIIPAIQVSKRCLCPDCGRQGIKYGFKVSYVKMTESFSFPVWIRLKKQRYQCKHCRSTYLSETNLVRKGCFISEAIKQEILRAAATKISIKDIAARYGVSWATVQRVIKDWYKNLERNFHYLPQVLGVDEFRAVSTIKDSKFAFSIIDGITQEVFDICPDRKQGYLLKYFGQYSEEARANVTHITMDMHDPYMAVSRRLFPNAKICIDKFHVVQLASNALDKCRVEVMKGPLEVGTYKIFKRFWRLPLTNSKTFDIWKTRWVSHWKTMKTQGYLLGHMLEQSEILRNTWEFYQRLLIVMDDNDPERFLALLKDTDQPMHPQMMVCVQTLKRYRKYICNALETGYTNAVTEAINNHFKVLKRIAYGYRNYDNNRARIFLVLTDKVKTKEKVA